MYKIITFKTLSVISIIICILMIFSAVTNTFLPVLSVFKETKKDIQEPFFIVPSRIFELGLNPYELSVLLYLMMRADNKTHSCFPSEKGIAKACGMGRTTVSKSLCSLEEKNLIQKKWHTDETVFTNECGNASFKGFYGKYDLKIEIDGVVTEKEIILSSKSSNSFCLEV